jgi:hypothetical protein
MGEMIRRFVHAIVVLLLLLGRTALVSAQSGQAHVEPQASSSVLLEPLGSPGAVNSPLLFGAGDALAAPAIIKIDLAFDFVQPIFSNRSVSLAIPGTNTGAVGATGNFSDHFTFLPGVAVEHPFGDLGFGIAASAKALQISGNLIRTVAVSNGVNDMVTASGTVTVASANVIEGTALIDLGATNLLGDTCLRDTLVGFSLGGRYSYVNQNYTATLVAGNAQGTLTGTQEFTGFGLTSSLNTISQLPGAFVFYTSTRGSFLIGNNARTSVLGFNTPAPAPPGTHLSEKRSQVVPALECEVGIGYGLDLARAQANPIPATHPLLWFKVGCVGQLWGNVGLLPINDAIGNQFSDSSLLLLGFSVRLGLDY